ncbi:Uncharacterised protein [[Pasteurella] mairii]|uniref:ESPR domain-containing protein n=1 Tax=[Pasteurella] mairii TaxID=757 RepID=A0A379B7K2_9PAST|nr:Uncharacterised protein [[Pasteurella] mairii]
MKNVFKVIWDSSAQCWVAVSELARSLKLLPNLNKPFMSTFITTTISVFK